jgi:hypothetical protein
MLVMGSKQVLKSQSPLLGLLQQRNKLPVVHKRDVHCARMDVSEKKKRRQEAEENQKCTSSDPMEQYCREEASEIAWLSFTRSACEELCACLNVLQNPAHEQT